MGVSLGGLRNCKCFVEIYVVAHTLQMRASERLIC